MKTEQIERYLTRQMADEERAAFEQEMQEQPQLAEDVKIVAWTIEAIRERGRQKDAETIRRMREGMGSDSKRYTATVAAVIGGVLVVAAMTVVSIPPLYQHVIKPIIESVFTSQEKNTPSAPQQPSSSKQSNDSLAANSTTDSVDLDANGQIQDQDVVDRVQAQTDGLAKDVNVKEETTLEETKAIEKAKLGETTNQDNPLTKEETKPIVKEKSDEKPKSEPVKIPKMNRVESVEDLKDYKVTLKSVKRVGPNVVCIIEMMNTEEDAKVKITNARAEATDGTYFGPGVCKINGKDSNKEIKEKWKKGETHQVELIVEGVANNIMAFEKVSFLFESEGKSNPQKRKTIRLQAGDIR